MFRSLIFALVIGTWAIGSGCSDRNSRPSVTIQGTVTLDGKPLPQGSIHFTSPLTGESAYMNLEPGGKYAVTFPEADVGEAYEISIQRPQIEEDDAHAKIEPIKMDVKIPPKYTNRRSSGLTLTIESGGEQTYDVDLSSS